MARPKREIPTYSETSRALGPCVEYKGHVIEPETGRIFGIEVGVHADTSGYRQVYLDARKTAQAHRFVWEAVHGPIPSGMFINHINGVKHDNRLENLELVTHRENILHAFRTGLSSNRGQRHPGRKLNNVQVLAIRALAAAGVSRTEIARRTGMSITQISNIVRRVSWSHLPEFPVRLEDM